MVEFRKLKDLIRQKAKDNEFDVATGDFGNLVVQAAEGFHFFYDSAEKRLIKSFVVREVRGSTPCATSSSPVRTTP